MRLIATFGPCVLANYADPASFGNLRRSFTALSRAILVGCDRYGSMAIGAMTADRNLDLFRSHKLERTTLTKTFFTSRFLIVMRSSVVDDSTIFFAVKFMRLSVDRVKQSIDTGRKRYKKRGKRSLGEAICQQEWKTRVTAVTIADFGGSLGQSL